MITYVLIIVAFAFIFDFINGFHDSANSIATIVGTRVLSPLAAVGWAALFNFAGAFVGSTAVAKAVSSGFVVQSVVDANVILAGLLGAIIWDLITWWFGIPTSSSHAIIGGFAGAAVSKGGTDALLWGTKWIQTLSAIVISPVMGLIVALALMILVLNLFQRATPSRMDRVFRPGQLLSSAFLSYAHGQNDAQKTMGIIVGLLVATQAEFAQQTGWLRFFYLQNTDRVPYWVEFGAYTAIALGTLFGGWRIVHTMGSRVTRLRPVSGFCAETGGAMVMMTAAHYGIPISTTHTITGSIVGVGTTQRLSAVRWGIARRIVWAWVITIPAAMTIAAVSYRLLALFNKS
ncbi:MAG TPA: inorganic phosphate transporter [Gemmatimonadaceae bacterium]|nr:inorganic phosphate transporter [Gemmatimonadaceae bacterium]